MFLCVLASPPYASKSNSSLGKQGSIAVKSLMEKLALVRSILTPREILEMVHVYSN